MGELSAILAILCINVIYAYGVYLPAASGQLNLGAAGFIMIGAYAGAWLNSSDLVLVCRRSSRFRSPCSTPR